MWPTFVTWLFDNYPLVFIFVGVVFLTIFCCHKVYKFYYKRFAKVEKDVEDHGDHLKGIHFNLTGIKKTTSRIESYLITNHRETYTPFMMLQSPYSLTEKGEIVLTESGCSQIIEDYRDEVFRKIDGKKPETAIDVEGIIRAYLFKLYETDAFNSIKKYVFKNPKFEDTFINIYTLTDLMVIRLRELYMKEHPEVPSEEPAVNDKPSD